MSIKETVFDILRGGFLVDENSFKNWRFILFIVSLLLSMIWSAHSVEQKVIEHAMLSRQMKELRSEFLDTKAIAMKMKLESNIKSASKKIGLLPSVHPPQIIRATRETNAK
jgi:hypothetical protein